MRDYSSPRKSAVTPAPNQSRPRQESSGFSIVALIVTATIFTGLGFGSGWMLSERKTKKGFQAAMQQQSLENSPIKEQVPLPLPTQTPNQQQSALQHGTPAPQPVPETAQQPQQKDQPLSFYKTLPSGQKNTALGSGINSKDEKTAKQPLQAVIPAGTVKTVPPAENVPAKPATAAVPGKNPTAANRFTVQAGSYSLKSEAESLRNTLAAKGYYVTVIESNLGEKGIWYRVRVGRQLDQEAAKDLAKKIGKGAIAIPDKES